MTVPAASDHERDVRAAIAAAAAGDTMMLRLLDRNPGIVRGGQDLPQPLPYAVRAGHIEAVRVLLDAGAPPDHIGGWGDTLVEAPRSRVRGGRAAGRRRPTAARSGHAVPDAHRPSDSSPRIGDRRRRTRARAPRRRFVAGEPPRPLRRHATAPRGPRPRATSAALLLDRGADIDAVHGAGLGARTIRPRRD